MEKFLSVYGAETTYIAASAAIIAAIISGLVAIGGYILTSRNNTKLSFINTATASRIKWMSEVRELLSDFITFLPQYNPFVLGKIKNDEFDFTNDYFNLNKLIKIKTKLELLLGSKEKECNRESNEDDRDLKVLNSVKEAFDIVNKLNIFFTMYLCNSQNENENLATELDEDFCEKILENLEYRFFQGNKFKDNREKLIYFLSSTKGSNEEFLKHVYIVNINSSIKDIINKELNSKVNEIVKNSQESLKFEWERVKKESKKGDLKKRNKLMKPFKK
ncbi:hypothetical protein [Clostridium celatum]|uniref:hypothetical protein n=1 Tax=Clostridium celatum TaxID=36834 RepID=UPI00319E0E62